ncbi:MAG: hypothetical protein OI717_00685 (plasmid) [Candidatus Methanoperedens sp.]|nr:MAG: hypothetical protein OI717_00685 [Candidatus Methanoperedens sp.]
MEFEYQVQMFIDTENEVAFKALRKLAMKRIVEVNNHGVRRRLKV